MLKLIFSLLVHNLDFCLTTVVMKAGNLSALHAICSVVYKGIDLTAKFYTVKGTAANKVPLLSYDL